MMDATSRYDPKLESQRLVARMFRMRTLGLGTGCIAVAAVLYEQQSGAWAWFALALTCVAWPGLALMRARRAADPQRTEWQNLMFDSGIGGFWVAVMEFNLVPSAVLVSMLAADKVGVGGFRLLSRCLAFQAVICLASATLLGFPFRPDSSMSVVLASLPFLFVYPIGTGWTAYRLARKVVRQNRELDRLSRTDGLSGLANRTHWEEMARIEFLRARRSKRHSALLLLDVDNFKQINDRHGHGTGDAVLRCIATRMRELLRAIDTPGRFGGDEFGAVLVEINPPDVSVPAERLRAGIAAIRLDDAPDLRVTVSIGAALFDPELPDATAWLKRADAALYAAKQAGRNRVHVWSEATSAHADAVA